MEKNLPTAPEFKMNSEKNFQEEKQSLTESINRFYNLGKGRVGLYPHPMFGSFTPDQWGQSMYKHLDHHLRQFGA